MKLALSCWVRWQNSRGQTMAEYALVMAGIAIVAYIAYQYLGNQVSTAANSIGGSI